MKDLAENAPLCEGLDWRQWDAVLACGRHQPISSQCWLETYSKKNEVFAVFIYGSVGLRPLSLDAEDCGEICLLNSPAIIKIVTDYNIKDCHWVAGQAVVYFYTRVNLLKAFSAAPVFACNFADIISSQHSLLIENYDDPANHGIKRLINSLLARADSRKQSSIKVLATQAELAFESGLSRQWVNHLLRGLEKKGIAQLGRGYVTLQSQTALMDYCSIKSNSFQSKSSQDFRN